MRIRNRSFAATYDRQMHKAEVAEVTVMRRCLLTQAAGLPGGNCRCPHWGYVIKGRLTVHYDDRDEIVEAGDAFYMPPGHVPAADEGTEFVQFSPAGELAATTEAIKKTMSS